MKRVVWTEDEERKVFNAAKDIISQQKVKLPFTKVQKFLDVLRSAQVVIEEPRRRKLYNLDSVARFLPKFREQGWIPDTFHATPSRGEKKEQTDPNKIRINQLADERDAALSEAVELRTKVNDLEKENKQLRMRLSSVPSEAEVVKGFIADILSRSKALPGPRLEPVPVPPPAPTPPQPKHNPEPIPQTSRPPKIVVVGAQDNFHARLHNELKDVADMRYITGDTLHIGEKLKAFKDPAHGKVILWTRFASHQTERSLQYENVPFVKVDVQGIEGLVDVVKRIAAEQGGTHA